MFPSHEKARYVRRMFDAIVLHYDLMNRLMTAGQDEKWRRRAAGMIDSTYARALDVACGTADLSLALARRVPSAYVYAIDFSPSMIRRGTVKAIKAGHGNRIFFSVGDALQLPFADNSFDAVTSGFLMRNVENIRKAFAEMRRVVRPAGKVVCLEISKPSAPIFRELFWWYFTRLVPAIGRVISGHPQAYTYLPQSLASFVTAEELQAEMEKAGLRNVSFSRLMLGTIAIHVGEK